MKDYKKLYEEILEWARKNKARLNGVPIEEVLPELSESEDERIRKDIINLIYWLKGNPSLCSQYYKDRYDGILAWLEKQKEQKPAEVCYGPKGDPDPAGVWKPSDEQLEELNKVRTLNPDLDALYQQLKNM